MKSVWALIPPSHQDLELQAGAAGGWFRPGRAGAPWIGSPRADGRRGATGRPWRLRGGPGSGAEPPVGAPGPPASSQGWRLRLGALGRCGLELPGAGPAGAGLPGVTGLPWRPRFTAGRAAGAPGPWSGIAGRGRG
jgi:hypothetical protein